MAYPAAPATPRRTWPIVMIVVAVLVPVVTFAALRLLPSILSPAAHWQAISGSCPALDAADAAVLKVNATSEAPGAADGPKLRSCHYLLRGQTDVGLTVTLTLYGGRTSDGKDSAQSSAEQILSDYDVTQSPGGLRVGSDRGRMRSVAMSLVEDNAVVYVEFADGGRLQDPESLTGPLESAARRAIADLG